MLWTRLCLPRPRHRETETRDRDERPRRETETSGTMLPTQEIRYVGRSIMIDRLEIPGLNRSKKKCKSLWVTRNHTAMSAPFVHLTSCNTSPALLVVENGSLNITQFSDASSKPINMTVPASEWHNVDCKADLRSCRIMLKNKQFQERFFLNVDPEHCVATKAFLHAAREREE